jgi:hypothetical protein
MEINTISIQIDKYDGLGAILQAGSSSFESQLDNFFLMYLTLAAAYGPGIS